MCAKRTFSGPRSFFATITALVFLAAPLAVERVAAASLSPELKKVIEGAKKEGVLQVQWLSGRLAGDAGMRQMVAAMNKRYGTNVKLQFTPGQSMAKMLNKLAQEKAAGRPASSDLLLGTANHITRGLKKNMLIKMDWNSILERPVPSDTSLDRVATGGAGVAIASRIAGISYNTKLVKASDVPVSMEDVFKPKWKGKIASTPYGTGFYQFAAKDKLGYERMKDYVQRLARQIGGLVGCGAMDRIGSGEFMLLIFDCGHDDSLRLSRRGAPLAHTVVKEATRINIIYFGVPKHAQHPKSAILFTNFLNTKEGQILQWKLAGHDLYIYPEAHTRPMVQKFMDGGGMMVLDSVQRVLQRGHEEEQRIRKEFIKILKKGGK